MANLKAIRLRIGSVKSTRQMTSAMKMVAAAKLRKAQDKIVKLRPYADKMNVILSGLSQSLESSENENIYGRVSEVKSVLLVVVTSNKGLCGAFNSNVVKETKRLLNEKYSEQYALGKVSMLPIGKKGFESFKKFNVNMLPLRDDLVADLKAKDAMKLAEEVMNEFAAGKYDCVEIIYNQFKSNAVQLLVAEQFLPIVSKEEESTNITSTDYIYEPNKEEIVSDLIPKSLKIQFYKAILDSYVSENGARMTAMQVATDNATELLGDLTLQYNKARQAAITNQLIEVVSGAEAMG